MGKHFLTKLFAVYKTNGHIVFKFLGMKITFKNFKINQLEDCCCIPNIEYFLSKNIRTPHPVGIVIHPKAIIGNNCSIYQNVTIGNDEKDKGNVPEIGDNVIIYANAVVFGKIKIGNNVKIGAGAIVNKDVPDNCIVVGNPMKIINAK